MLFGKRQKRTVFLSLLVCVTFVAVAIWSWGVPLDDILSFFWLSLALMALLIFGAALLVLVLKFARLILRRNNRDPDDKT